MKKVTTRWAVFFAPFLISGIALASARDAAQDAAKVAALDTQYQAAVKSNDYATMDRILGKNFVVVLGTGHVYTRSDLISYARKASRSWEHQEEIDGSQRVRVWGDTAVVTAKLWIKGNFEGHPMDAKLWFSDTYVRTRSGWKYVFGQSSIPLPARQ